jgi:protein ImuA
MMPRAAILDDLQAYLDRHRQMIGETPWPAAGREQDALDAALPGNGLATGVLHEILPATHADFPAALGFSLGIAARILQKRPGHILWVMPGHQIRAHGSLYPDGLASFGIDPDRLIEIRAPKTREALWAIEETLAHSPVAAVLGVLPDNDRSYDFTASRRLSMRAARQGVTALILPARPELDTASAAHMRWSAAAGASPPAFYTGQPVPGLGTPRWHIRLLKSRKGGSGQWHLEWDHEALCFRLAAPLAGRTPHRASGLGHGQRATA